MIVAEAKKVFKELFAEKILVEKNVLKYLKGDATLYEVGKFEMAMLQPQSFFLPSLQDFLENFWIAYLIQYGITLEIFEKIFQVMKPPNDDHWQGAPNLKIPARCWQLDPKALIANMLKIRSLGLKSQINNVCCMGTCILRST